MATKSANDIVKEAAKLGACSKSGSVTDWKSLVWLFFSPQGREFCEENNFPNIEMFREMKPYVKNWGVYVDAGNIVLENVPTAGIIGDTQALLSYSDNTKVHKLILMHGGKARVTLSHYAVLLLVNIGNCEVEIENDGTAKVM
ncbi:hypothetical protein M1P97_09155 [Parabacteroides sp. GYB001]|uniref:hypothetical protein n=1 Tax=Parabacteroides leei TaxID=2939491 RepID=UPI002016FBB4|nr:hypothetical protein [Parabacteroides leei]MCL3851452.1 hypothetical protein [Parabacteroides leei]